MQRTADFVILGAGIAGMTLQRVLRGTSAVLIDGAPGRYKIGESIIPQHFVEPEVRPLYEIVRELPSATPKDGTLFISDDSVGGFELLDINRTLHIARQELEAATAKFFDTEIVQERIESIDVDSRTVTTDRGTYIAKELIIDCSGPARLVARSLGLAREVWPVFASWAYHDVLDVDDQRLFDVLRRGDKSFFRYRELLRTAEPSQDYEGFRPSCCTNLTQVADGVWTWQIPLYRATRLSVGVVSRHGPISAEQYRDVVARSIAPQYRTRMREWDHSGPFNSFHVRNRFAWAADRFAGDSWALVGDAAFFGDPVYSVGTGFATNHAIQLGRALRDGGWGRRRAEAHDRVTSDLYARTKRAYDGWYFGKVVTDGAVAEEIQTGFLTGKAFQVQTLEAYSEMWLVSHPQDAWYGADPGRGEDVTARVAALLEKGGVLVGWRLAAAGAFRGRLELEWKRPDAAAMAIKLERVERDRSYHRVAGGIGLRYRRPETPGGELDGQGRALFEALAALAIREGARLSVLIDAAGSEPRPGLDADKRTSPGDASREQNSSRGVDVTERVAAMLETTALLPGWRLTSALALGRRLELEWEAPGALPLGINLQPAVHGAPYYRSIGQLGLRYRRQEGPTGELDAPGRALIDAFVRAAARKAPELQALVDGGSSDPVTSVDGRGMPPRRRSVTRVGVVGGGTAGYLTALALRRRHPSLEVTLIESSRIPIIGVGEATTPDLVEFLHGTLGIDELELYREVAPTWKLGIRFLWGAPGDHVFHHPFTGEHLLEAIVHARDQDLQSLGAQLMKAARAPLLREPDGSLTPLLSTTAYAYHLDNARFVAFLTRLAARRGVVQVDCVIDDVAVGPDGCVQHLRADDGRKLSFDLYVDATGFRSLLLQKTLGVAYRSYASSLLCDTAVFADVPRGGGGIAPFTLAETMNAGWCWNIPQVTDDHRGYVFASTHLSADQAEAEMRAKNPGMGEPRLVRFRSGRLEKCWAGNVVGLGNAYAFVEPLESTALHMLVHQIGLLLDAVGDETDTSRARMNDAVGAHWDILRGFLALHYRFNRKLDTPFWKDCRARVDLAAGEAIVAAFGEGAPLVARPDRRRLEDDLFRTGFFGLLGVDNVLLGQGVPTRLLAVEPRRVEAFERWAHEQLPSILSRALPHREALVAYTGWLSERRSP
ncbi:MAG TPA: tryptophan 7-halogenase [Polyangiaceae bacterium]